MRTSSYSSMSIHHDGDSDGCMYLEDEDGVRIVTSRLDLEAAIAVSIGEQLSLTGPDGNMHDRHEVTAPTFDKVMPGPWTMVTATVAREDVEDFLLNCRMDWLTDIVERLDQDRAHPEFKTRLDAAIALLKPLVDD